MFASRTFEIEIFGIQPHHVADGKVNDYQGILRTLKRETANLLSAIGFLGLFG